jgi:DNA helicase HerA-like ATPase
MRADQPAASKDEINMTDDPGIFIGRGTRPVYLLPQLANRHGLIAGATGTGKTVTLQVLAEEFSRRGVPVFLADIKGDLSGISRPGVETPALLQRAQAIGLRDYRFEAFPVQFWDIFGRQGHRVRATVSEMGPLLFARLLGLSEAQEGVLYAAFKLADDQGLLLLDLKDLRALLAFAGEHAKELTLEYGNITRASVGAIQRRLLVLEEQGGGEFLGEPALDLHDFLRPGDRGYGMINILAADQLMQSPRLYATFLLWLLSELFEELPEVGDPEKPRLVFFFDEAHLLFDDVPGALIDKVEQVVRLIRSKGIGVYFVTQNPLDVPEKVLGQLGNRVQHALRAFTPRDQKAVQVAAETFRANPQFDAAGVITELGIGEALVSTLEGKGTPGIVERTLIRPPASRLGAIAATDRETLIRASALGSRYDQSIDRVSAYEVLRDRAGQRVATPAESGRNTSRGGREPVTRTRSSSRQSVMEAMVKSVVRSVGSSLGRQIVRGILGSILKR